MLTYTSTLNSAGSVYDNIWKTFGVSDYSTAVIRLSGIWDGPISFWGDNTPTNSVPLAVQDISSTNWTTAAVSETGASPSTEVKIFRVPVAGLTRIGIYGDIYSSPPNQFSSVGDVTITITLTSDTNAR
jgi:hypothetical protein